MARRQFIARFEGGKCSDCMNPIHAGEELAFNPAGSKHKYRHVHCSERKRDLFDNTTTTRLTCSSCSLDVHYLYPGNLCAACASKAQEEKEAKERAIGRADEAIATLDSKAKTEELAATTTLDTAQDMTLKNVVDTAIARLNTEASDVLTRVKEKSNLELINVHDSINQRFDELDSSLSQTITKEILAYVAKATRVEIVNTDQTVIDAGNQHHCFPKLIKMMSAKDHRGHRLNIWIAGPAGTGKTSAVENAAAALDLEYASTGALIESYRVFGFISPGTGIYVPTLFRNIWENGGVFLFDDCDGSDPSVFVELNNALANGSCAFPDAQIKKHPDCCLVLTANTWGLGATNDYVGRLKQDAATLDRFVKLYWPTDEDLELATTPNRRWTERVQAIRKLVKDKGIKVLVTPRATYYGAALLAGGMDWEDVEIACLKSSMTDDQWQSLQN